MAMDGLIIRTTDEGEGPLFERFFAGYDRAFVLPEEKEDREGFRACLALNHGAAHERLAAEYGPFRELCLVAEDYRGALVGGANLIATRFALPGAEPVVTVNLNYVYIDPERRGRGCLRELVRGAGQIAAAEFREPGEPLIFIEQNDPFRMSAEAYARDTTMAGIDQLDRLRIWAKLGARILDFDYVQPALSPAHEPDENLLYALLGGFEGTVCARLVAGHLRRFFGISVLKGRPLSDDAAATAQLHALERHGEVALLDPRPLLARLESRQSARALPGGMPRSTRAAIAALA